MGLAKDTLRVAALGDLHCSKASAGTLQPLFAQITEAADVLVLCGDLTDFGLPEEAHILAKELTTTMGLCGVNTIAEIDDHVLAI